MRTLTDLRCRRCDHEIERNCLQPNLALHLREAEEKAWDSVSRYKFMMFGYCFRVLFSENA